MKTIKLTNKEAIALYNALFFYKQKLPIYAQTGSTLDIQKKHISKIQEKLSHD